MSLDEKLTDVNRVSFFSWFLPDVKVFLDKKSPEDIIRRMKGKNFNKISDPSFFTMSKAKFSRCGDDIADWRNQMFKIIQGRLLPSYWKEMTTHEAFEGYIGEALQFINFLEENGLKNDDNVLTGTKLFTCSLGALK